MKPAIIQHTEYKRMLRARLNAYFPDKSEIQKEIAPLYRKFRDLDLSAVDRIMQSHYSNFGPYRGLHPTSSEPCLSWFRTNALHLLAG